MGEVQGGNGASLITFHEGHSNANIFGDFGGHGGLVFKHECLKWTGVGERSQGESCEVVD